MSNERNERERGKRRHHDTPATGTVDELQKRAGFMLRSIEELVESLEAAEKAGTPVFQLAFDLRRGRLPTDVFFVANEGGVRFQIDREETRLAPSDRNRNWVSMVTYAPEPKRDGGSLAYVRPVVCLERLNELLERFYAYIGEDGKIRHPADKAWLDPFRAVSAERREKARAEREAAKKAETPPNSAMKDALADAGLASTGDGSAEAPANAPAPAGTEAGAPAPETAAPSDEVSSETPTATS